MTKLIALVAAGAFAAGTVFAGEHGECGAKTAGHEKAAFKINYAKLDLTADQKTKLEAAKAECDKAGCNEASTAKFLKDAEGILSKEQYAKLKAECNKKGAHKHESKA